MRVLFDGICDEALVFKRVSEWFRQRGDTVAFMTLGRRWHEAWKDVERFPLDVRPDASPEARLRAALARLELSYADFRPMSFLHADRYLALRPREYQYRALVQTFRAVEELIDRWRPDAIVTTGVAYLYHLVFHAVARRRGVSFLSLYPARTTEPRFTVSTGYGGRWDLVDRAYAHISSHGTSPELEEQARRWFQRMAEQQDPPNYAQLARNRPELRWVQVREFITRAARWYFRGWKGAGDYFTQAPSWYARRDLKKILLAHWVRFVRQSVFDEPADEPFFLFPLHLQPEASTLILAPEHADQVALIRNIARVLPADFRLYVKEHPAALGRRPLTAYRTLAMLPNVRLIPPWQPASALTRASQGVITLSSTMGWEALFLGRPTYILGNVFYESAPGVSKVTSFDELGVAIRRATVHPSDRELIKFVAAFLHGTAPGLFEQAKMELRDVVLAESNIGRLTTGIARFLRELAGFRDESCGGV